MSPLTGYLEGTNRMDKRTNSVMSATTYQPEGTAPGASMVPTGVALSSDAAIVAPAKAPKPSPADSPPPGSPTEGLSETEAAARRARGLGNEFHPQTSRSYLQIVKQHAFSFIN